ncbi:holo-ACP synthase [Buchnera aphidicola]|uniref:holo-ACP synthase n=1 Tax=Buchnera aphidicola TaxID=9 RepID=UPI0030EBFF9E
MIIGIGIDLLKYKRIKRIFKIFKNRFVKKILSKNEIKIFYKKKNINFLAKRFVIKEAASKAFGTGINYGIFFKNFEIYKNKKNKPKIKYFKKNLKFIKKKKIKKSYVSFTKEKKYFSSIVILEN